MKVRFVDRDDRNFYWNYEVKVDANGLVVLDEIVKECNELREKNDCDISWCEYFEGVCAERGVEVESLDTLIIEYEVY